MGTVEFTATPVYSSIHFNLTDGPGFNAGDTAQLSGGSLILKTSGSIPFHDGIGDEGEGFFLTITLVGVNGPGTYVCPGPSGSQMDMNLIRQAGGPNGGNWNSQDSGGSATVVITSIDFSTRVFSGTFTGTLVPAMSYQFGKQVINNGTFQISFL